MNSPPKLDFYIFWNIGQYPLELYKHVVKSRNARKQIFFLCLRNPCENTFSKLPIFFVYIYKKSIQNMLGYWLYATHKKIFFYIFFLLKKTQVSQLIAINCGLDGIQQGST
jgi:hypothetical protein